MKIRIKVNRCYHYVDPAVGKDVEAREEVKDWGILYHVSVEELERVGCTGVSGSDYPFYPEEIEIIEE